MTKRKPFVLIVLCLAFLNIGLPVLGAQTGSEIDKPITTTTVTQAFPLTFGFYSAPQQDGSVLGGALSYKWDDVQSSTIRFRQDTFRSDFEYADVADSLVVSYEESNRLDVLLMEWGWSNFGLSLGAMWSNTYKWEKGYFMEQALDPIFSFEETSDFNLLTPRIGLSVKLDEPSVKLNLSGYVSPIYLVTQDQSLGYNFDGTEETQVQNSLGPGFLGLDFMLNLELFDLVLLEGSFSNYQYLVKEWSFGSYGDVGGFEDYYAVEDKTYTRILVSASASLLVPLAQGKLQVGGSFFYRVFTSSDNIGNVEEPVFGFILGYKPRR